MVSEGTSEPGENFGKGIAEGAAGMIKGLAGGAVTGNKLMYGSPEEKYQVVSDIAKTDASIVKDPGLVVDAIKDPYVKSYDEAGVSKVAGRAFFDLAAMAIGGPKNLGQKVETKVAPEVAEAAQKLETNLWSGPKAMRHVRNHMQDLRK